MTNIEWNAGIEYLQKNEEGYIEHENRRVDIVEMCGGRFLLIEDHEIVGLVDEEIRAMAFLRG